MFVGIKNGSADTRSIYNDNLAAREKVASYADLIGTTRVAKKVIDLLGLDYTPDQLKKEIRGEAVKDTVLLRAVVTDRRADRARDIANAVGVVFTQEIADVENSGSAREQVRIGVWEGAALPSSPVSPKPVQNFALGLLGGIAVGFTIAIVRFMRDTSVKTMDDVANLTGLPMLGAIAFDDRTGRSPLAVVGDPRGTRAEAYRQLRTNLQFIDVDDRPQVISVTSALPAEGKSTVACNLAAALAQAGAAVVLLDADLRRPAIADYLGLEGSAGLTSIMIGQATIDEVLQPVGERPMGVVCSGPLPPNPSELLGSRAMASILNELRERFDYVIVDVPPLLPVTDAAVVSGLADGTLLVVRSGTTPADQLRRAVAVLQNVEARALGAVLNMVSARRSRQYSGLDKYETYQLMARLAETSTPTPARTAQRRDARLDGTLKIERRPVPIAEHAEDYRRYSR
jgi:non-specific protein-tyrosine kinase